MKTPLLILVFLAPLQPVVLGCDKSDCASTPSFVTKTPEPHLSNKAPSKAASPAQPTPSAAEKSRRAPAPRPPAYLFM